MKLKRPIRQFSETAELSTPLTLRELGSMTGECDRGLRAKLKSGAFKGAYRTNGSAGEWRIPLRSLQAYQKARSISIPNE